MEMLVEKNKIAAKIQADDWQDAIRKAGQLLIDSGDIEEGYVEHMIQRLAVAHDVVSLFNGLKF